MKDKYMCIIQIYIKYVKQCILNNILNECLHVIFYICIYVIYTCIMHDIYYICYIYIQIKIILTSLIWMLPIV